MRSLVNETELSMISIILGWLQHGGGKPTETSVTEFCSKSVDLLLKELINITVILFLILELFR